MGPSPNYIMSKKPRLVRVKLLFLLIAKIIQLQNFSLLNHIDTKIHRRLHNHCVSISICLKTYDSIDRTEAGNQEASGIMTLFFDFFHHQ